MSVGTKDTSSSFFEINYDVVGRADKIKEYDEKLALNKELVNESNSLGKEINSITKEWNGKQVYGFQRANIEAELNPLKERYTEIQVELKELDRELDELEKELK